MPTTNAVGDLKRRRQQAFLAEEAVNFELIRNRKSKENVDQSEMKIFLKIVNLVWIDHF